MWYSKCGREKVLTDHTQGPGLNLISRTATAWKVGKTLSVLHLVLQREKGSGNSPCSMQVVASETRSMGEQRWMDLV